MHKVNLSLFLCCCFLAASPLVQADQWPQYGGDNGGMRFAASAQITPANVGDLEVAWTYRTGEKQRRGAEAFQRSSFQATPLLLPPAAGQSLVFCTPFNRVVALDPATGAERWVHEPDIAPMNAPYRCRGVAYWSDSRAADPAPAACRHRIFSLTADRRLIALDAATGEPCSEFGEGGTVRAKADKTAAFPGEIRSASPPLVVNDTVVVGSALQDFVRRDAPRGTVFAFDARSGALKWSFDPVPQARRDPAYASWQNDSAQSVGQANVWTPMSADDERNLVLLPTSTATANFYGGFRPGDNLYANSTVALDADTGAVVWYFQVSHHDVWDYDLASQPVVADIRKDGKVFPVVIQATKQGWLFVFDRDTGKPYFPVEERAVPQNGLPGEYLSPTQPFPLLPPPLIPQTLTADDAWGFTFYDRGACEDKIRALRSEGIYTPVTERGTVFYPSSIGGMNWGGVAFDPGSNLVIANTNRVPMQVRAIPLDQKPADSSGGEKGDHVGGKAAMQALFPKDMPYGFEMKFLESPFGAPCSKPPWGSLVAVDLTDGSIVWDVPLGTIKKLAPLPIPWKLGTPNLGGPIITGGGLVFIGAAMDDMIRAFDLKSGEELWADDLPAGGQATPMSYAIDGRQFVVIAAGGHDILDTTRGDYVIAYALPAK
ncbi:MAG: pyrroloquinoline quinone-dependent dehydrogenase [Halioglobus sp.]|nr:pyrroloquinoline quinone-dependent dehydrogenase [Halioglobus sp.]